ncbi:MAG: hypothetical protein IPJ81_03510 [Chitinophagaceae bacterium]|nr:hypothetical protein [Chitinophagaceae bacterium]
MIYGIAEFLNKNKIKTEDIEIIFFEKGPDVENAKELCRKLNISTYITWKKEVSQYELNQIIKKCDVAFDQLGDQWIGYGIVVMAVGRPLIANGRPEVFEPLTGEQSPVCQAANLKEVSDWLELLFYSPEKKHTIGKASSIYVRKHYDINKTIDFITSI